MTNLWITYVLLLTCMTPVLFGQGDKPKEEWIEFKGKAQKQGSKYFLSAGKGGGAFDIDQQNVRISGGKVQVRTGVPARIVSAPTKRSLATKAAVAETAASDCVRQDDCPSKCCACIGLVRVCCGEGGTRGVCLGVWGCP